MEKRIKVQNLKDVRAITSAATGWHDAIEVCDTLGAIANAKSILGLMRLDYTKPVSLRCNNPAAVDCICKSLKKHA